MLYACQAVKTWRVNSRSPVAGKPDQAGRRARGDNEAMIGRLHHIAIDCPEPGALAGFYSELLGLPVTYESPDWVVIAANETSSGLAFQRAPEHQRPRWPDPAHPQQIHLDVMVDDSSSAGAQVVALGAKHLDGNVYEDPAGHPFCLIPRPGWAPPVNP
jgi:catechol 2,3-dioxygenase-like lactoylglutathione lyase family enzyme